MFEGFLIIAFFVWLFFKGIIWLFDSFLGIIPDHVADKVRRRIRFGIAVFIVLGALSIALEGG